MALVFIHTHIYFRMFTTWDQIQVLRQNIQIIVLQQTIEFDVNQHNWSWIPRLVLNIEINLKQIKFLNYLKLLVLPVPKKYPQLNIILSQRGKVIILNSALCSSTFTVKRHFYNVGMWCCFVGWYHINVFVVKAIRASLFYVCVFCFFCNVIYLILHNILFCNILAWCNFIAPRSKTI